MGNYASCCSINRLNLHTAKLFDATGNVRRVKVPITAAELMLEEPGHVVSPVEDIRRTRQVLAMRADDELEAGKVYLMVPVHRINCRASELEMAIIESTTCERRWSKGDSSKVLPAGTEGEKEKSEGPDRVLGGGDDTGFPRNRLGSYRQWAPALEPISEAY